MAFKSDEDVQNFHKFLEIYYKHSVICDGDQVIEWLEKRGSDPDFWHQTVTHWNWDAGVNVLHWIARQPACEVVTASWMLIFGGPGGYLYRSRDDCRSSSDLSVFDLYKDIADRLRTGFYRSNQLGLYGKKARDFAQAVASFRQERSRIGNPAIWELPNVAFGPFHGREAIPSRDAVFEDGQLRMTMGYFRERYGETIELPTSTEV